MSKVDLVKDYGVIVIFECLDKIKKLKDANKVRKALRLTTQKFDILITQLHELHLIKNLSNMPVITSPVLIVTPKGEEFIKRFQHLTKLLGEQ